jgi:hypothetical protein
MVEGAFLVGAEGVDVQVGRALAVPTITSMLTVMVMAWSSR